MASYRKRNGTWQYRISYKDIYTGKYKEKTKGGFKRRADAIEAARRVELSITDGFNERNDNPLFKNYSEQWLLSIKETYRPNSFFSKSQSVRRVNNKIGNISIKQINANVIQKYLNELAKNKYSYDTIKADYITIHQVIKKSIRENYIYRDPFESVKLPASQIQKHARYWTEEDFNYYIYHENKRIQNLERQKNPRQYLVSIRNFAIICILGGCGIRIGELCGLMIDCYSPEDHVLTIKYNYTKGNEKATHAKYERTEFLKTDHSFRTVPMIDKSWKALDKWLSVRDYYYKHFNLVDDGTLFATSTNGLPVTPDDVRQNFSNALSRHEMEPINLHGLRHTYASLLALSGASPKEAQSLLGHKSVVTTLQIYTHISETGKKDAVSKLNNLLENKKSSPHKDD